MYYIPRPELLRFTTLSPNYNSTLVQLRIWLGRVISSKDSLPSRIDEFIMNKGLIDELEKLNRWKLSISSPTESRELCSVEGNWDETE